MFRDQTDKYSQFDESGLPTHDTSGELLFEKQVKKLHKLWQDQEKKYQEYISKTQGNPQPLN